MAVERIAQNGALIVSMNLQIRIRYGSAKCRDTSEKQRTRFDEGICPQNNQLRMKIRLCFILVLTVEKMSSFDIYHILNYKNKKRYECSDP